MNRGITCRNWPRVSVAMDFFIDLHTEADFEGVHTSMHTYIQTLLLFILDSIGNSFD